MFTDRKVVNAMPCYSCGSGVGGDRRASQELVQYLGRRKGWDVPEQGRVEISR